MRAQQASRRSALALGTGAALALSVGEARATERVPTAGRTHARFAYVGCYTTAERNGQGKGIAVFRVDGPGRWQLLETIPTADNPSFLALDRTQSFLYAVHGDRDQVSAYAVSRRTGRLTPLNSQSSQGTNPVHLALAPDNSRLLVANYATGTLAVLPIARDGTLRPATQVVGLTGTAGPHRSQQTGPHPHH
ncbi:lactonase family protein, partial [Streptomyces spongiae]